jgi:predicted DCC family thiol-disulfide oxidoreductase YuxK
VTEAERSAIEGRTLLLYDGVCVLCNGVVRFLIRRDKLDRFRYAPLQSRLGRAVLARFDIHVFPDGVVLLTDALMPGEHLYRRSDAVLEALRRLGAPWGLMGRVLKLVPHCLRDRGYRSVARIRYRLFGRYGTCPMPSPELRGRMLGLEE